MKGGTRRELGQENNFESRGQAGNEADAVLRLLRDRVGAPTLEGTKGRNAVAGATEVGSNRDSLVDAVSRNIIRSGGSNNAGGRAVDAIDQQSGRNLRTVLAKNDATAPELTRVATEGWNTGMHNRFNPMQAVRSNITDAPFAPTQVGAPIDASLDRAATTGAATFGRNAGTVNQAGAMQIGVNQTPMPWGSAFGALTDAVKAYAGTRNRAGDNKDPNDPSYNSGRGW